jgi:2-oxoglutarate ferredoxin oxidoreductase subunit alpha
MGTRPFSFLVGGVAGEGVKKAGFAASRLFGNMGRHVFQMDDYMSLIRGGHNFSVVTSSPDPVHSHYMKADLAVALDRRSYDLHRDHVAPGGTLVFNYDAINPEKGQPMAGMGIPLTGEARKYPNPQLRMGVGAVTVLASAVGLSEVQLEELIRAEYARDAENNLAYARAIYALAQPLLGGKYRLEPGELPGPCPIISGNEAISLGAAAAGLDVYMAYPMTPASSILHFLAANSEKLGVTTVHPENEIAVANMAIGAAFAGARAMVGSSGGGFALMEEAISLAGITETPLYMVLSSRPGPSTGVPTYTAQGDLRFALGQGHGEFPQVVASPGTVAEAYSLSAQLLELAWRFQTVTTLLTEKHLSESRMTTDIVPSSAAWAEPILHDVAGGEYLRYRDTPEGISPALFPPTKELNKWNSYEHDEAGITTEDPGTIAAMADKRRRKGEALVEHLKGLTTVNTFGEGEQVLYTYGSTTMSVIEAVRAGWLDATVVQPVFLEPLPIWELERFSMRDAIAVEQSSTGQFAALLREKGGLEVKAELRKYDGRPFDPEALAGQLRGVM